MVPHRKQRCSQRSQRVRARSPGTTLSSVEFWGSLNSDLVCGGVDGSPCQPAQIAASTRWYSNDAVMLPGSVLSAWLRCSAGGCCAHLRGVRQLCHEVPPLGLRLEAEGLVVGGLEILGFECLAGCVWDHAVLKWRVRSFGLGLNAVLWLDVWRSSFAPFLLLHLSPIPVPSLSPFSLSLFPSLPFLPTLVPSLAVRSPRFAPGVW
eukprot:772088-Rhodomonas_salina.1